MKLEIRITDETKGYDVIFTSNEDYSKEEAINLLMKAVEMFPSRENHLNFDELFAQNLKESSLK